MSFELGERRVSQGSRDRAQRLVEQRAFAAFLGDDSSRRRPEGPSLIQSFLPPSLRIRQTGPILQAGIQGIGDLIRNPGGLNPNVADAVRGRLAQESENIATNFRGIGANQRGAAARSNLPVSIKNALESALGVSQERAQRSARRGALADSEQLRRQDLQKTFDILNSILQFTSSGRSGAITGIEGASRLDQQNSASNMAFLGSLLSGLGSSGRSQQQQPNPVQ